MRPKIVLDSFALLAYLNKEDGFEKVRKVLAKAQESGDCVLMNEINVGETFYVLYRERGPEKAEYFLDTILAGLPVEMVGNSLENVIDAARIKAQYPLSFADCFAAATAQREKTALVTGDPEFSNIEHIVKIDWISKK